MMKKEQTMAKDPSYAVVSTPKPHRCGKNDLQPGFPEANGMRSMKCNKCHSVWHIEYRNNRVMNIFRDGVRQEV